MASNGKKGSGNAAPTQNEQKKPTTQVDQKNDAEQNETAQQPIPEIRVKIDKLFDDDTKKLKAFASANIAFECGFFEKFSRNNRLFLPRRIFCGRLRYAIQES